MISKRTLHFLKDLKENNDRDWFTANKARYEDAKLEFQNFIGFLIAEISNFDSSIGHLQAKDCIFRIYRDVRFSKDKSPYKPNFGAHITAASQKSELHSQAGYYIHLEPGATMLAGGAYLPESGWLNRIRVAIDKKGPRLEKILEDKEFKEYFGGIQGEKLKRPPQGYPPDHPRVELLKYKSFLAMHKVKDKDVIADNFIFYASSVFKALQPFDIFLNQA